MSFTKEMTAFFFTRSDPVGNADKICYKYTCRKEALTGQKCCSMKNSFTIYASAGFSNLRVHLQACLPDYRDTFDKKDAEGAADIRHFVSVDKKSQNIFRWIEWVVTSNLPFSFVENKMTRINTKNTRETISRTTLMKYLDQLGYEIEEVLAKIIPDRFALAFDGWDNGNNSNYCGVFVM